MRLHRLELTAIGPYASSQCIDFAELTRSGLFLLEGPTGAGKTTILDAITFALYGGLSGDGSGRDRLHSDFADPAVEPTVTLEFSVRGVRYRIRRAPEYERPRKRGGGTTTQAVQVHLERHDGTRWVSLSCNKAEVGELIGEVIGLSRDQFTQVMLLPQGEFARFLRSDDDDRRQLLTRLFGTGLYDLITAELDQRRREATTARQDAQAQIQAAAAAAAEAAGLDAAERDELLALGRDERDTRLKEIAAELSRSVDASRDALEVAAAGLAAAQQAADRASRRAELLDRLTQALDRLAEHQATRPEHERRAERLAAARRAEPVRPLLAELAEAQASLAATGTALAALVEQSPAGDPAESAEPGGPESLDVAAILAAVGAGGAAGGAGAAADWAARIAARGDEADRAAAALAHLADQEAALPDREAALTRLRAAEAEAVALTGRLELARQELPGRIDAVETRLSGARIAAAGLADAQAQQAAVAGRLAAAIKAADLAADLAGLDAGARAAIDAHQQLVDACQRAMAARLENMAADLAGQLGAGMACPVCGSTQHPEPAAGAPGAVSAQDVAEAELRRDEAAAARERAEAARDEVAAELAGTTAAAGGQGAEELAAELAGLDERVLLAEQGAAEAAGLEPALADLHAERDRLDEDLTGAAVAAATAREQAGAAAGELDALRARLADAARPYPTVAERRAALRADVGRDRELERALRELGAARAAADRAAERAGEELSAGGFDDLAQAQAAVLPQPDQETLDNQVRGWTETHAALTAGTADPELAGLDAEQCAAAQASALAAAQALDTARAVERDVSAGCRAAAARDERLSRRLAELSRAEQESDRLAERTEPVIRLAALARGMDGQRRITLTTYVLRRWFEQVVAAANIRLAAMSAGRYELARIDGGAPGDRKNQRTGLALAVTDRYTGDERSPRSLSGGETFYTSLALALGLADVVRAQAGGVELDTLFIDEGFGSLDADTLDQVLTVIDDLRDRGRVVGIVSHVADLKDRVPERLEVRRLADGSSAVRVVA